MIGIDESRMPVKVVGEFYYDTTGRSYLSGLVSSLQRGSVEKTEWSVKLNDLVVMPRHPGYGYLGHINPYVFTAGGSLKIDIWDPAAERTSRGQGIRTKDGWAVVLCRRYPDGLTAKTRTQIAFAVWDGSQHEVGSRKMRSGWAPLVARERK